MWRRALWYFLSGLEFGKLSSPKIMEQSLGAKDCGSTLSTANVQCLEENSESGQSAEMSGVSCADHERDELNELPVICEVGDSDILSSWPEVSLVSSSRGENRMVIPLTVNGKRTRALIDTGAAHSMISVSWLMEEKVSIVSCPEQLFQGFGASSPIRAVGTVICMLDLHSLQINPQIFFAVECGNLDIPIILAVDFLSANQLSIGVRAKMLRQHLADGSVIDFYVGSAVEPCQTVFRNIPCCAAEDLRGCSIQPTCIRFTLPVYVDTAVTNYCCFCDEVDKKLVFQERDEKSQFHAYAGIVDPLNPVVLFTPRDKSVRVKIGDSLGSLSTAVEISETEPSGEVLVANLQIPQPSENNEPDELSLDKVKLGEHLTKEEKQAIHSLLNEHDPIFSRTDSDIGYLGVTKHRIELWDSTPIYQKPRRFPEPVSAEIESQCQELHFLDIIEPSSSAWSSPVVPVRKTDGRMRLCIDYRRLNEVTIADKFPIPNLSDAVFSLHGTRFFTSLDLVRGYYQLPLEESCRELTAFSTPRNHWQFKRLSFGLKNAPAAFQREMQHILSGFPRRQVVVYIDDVLIMSSSFEEHVVLVSKVLSTLINYGVKVKLAKCHWFEQEVEYLGHLVSRDGLRKPESYVQKVGSFPLPQTVKELREFLGLANFQRKFVPMFSSIQKPLSEKTGGRGRRKLEWTTEMLDAFNRLREKIQEDVLLTFPDYSPEACPLELYADASGIGAGACLAQKQGDQMKIIAYASTTFNAAERRYSTIERELTALRWAVKSLRPFLIGVDFIIHTDHQPLVYLQNMKIIDSRLARTLEDLADYNFQLRYTPGNQNAAADALSRLYHPDNVHSPADVDYESGRLSDGLVVLEKVDGGGNSLFESLHLLTQRLKLKKSVVDSSTKLREILVDDLLNRPERYKLKLDRDSRKKLRLAHHIGQLPPVEVLYSFARNFGCIVLVHYGGSAPVFYIPPDVPYDRDLTRVHLQCLAGVHYNPVVEMSGYCGPSDPVCHDLVDPIPPVVDDLEETVDVDLSSLGVVESESIPGRTTRATWCSLHPRTHLSSMMIIVAGRSYCALLDSGAQVSCVSFSLYQTQLVTINTDVRYIIRGLGQSRSSVLGTVVLTIDSPTGGASRPHTFAVVQDQLMPICVILGADYISDSNLVLDFHSRGDLAGGLRFAALTNDDVEYTNHAFPLTSHRIQEMAGSDPDLLCGSFGNDYNAASIVSTDEIIKLQRKDTSLRILKRALLDPGVRWPKALSRYNRYRDLISLRDDVIIFKHRESDRSALVVTFQFLVEIMLAFHYKCAHLGRQKLIECVKQHVWHPSLAKVAKDVTTSCIRCQQYKVLPVMSPPVYRIQTASPFELVCVDLVALPKSGSFIACLVVMDHYSKWLGAVPLSSKTSEAVSIALERKLLPFMPRCPVKILSDNGPEFNGFHFNELLNNYGIRHIYTTPNRPSSNGLVERANRTLLELLRVQVPSPVSWPAYLPRALIVHNSTYHSALEQSPNDFLLSERHALHDIPAISCEVRDLWREGHPSFGSFSKGQKVLMKTVLRGNETGNKFKKRFHGPYNVTEVGPSGVTYVLERDNGEKLRSHHGQLKTYHEPPLYLRRHPYFSSLESAPFLESEINSSSSEKNDDQYSGYVGRFSSEESSFSGFGTVGEESYGDSPESSTDTSVELETSVDSPSRLINLVLTKEQCSKWISPTCTRVYREVLVDQEDTAVISIPVPTDAPDEPLITPIINELTFPGAESSLPTANELPSGIVVAGQEDFWDVSPITTIDLDDTLPTPPLDCNHLVTVVEEVFGTLQDCVEQLAITRSSSDEVFSGFTTTESPIANTLRLLLLRTQRQAEHLQDMAKDLADSLSSSDERIRSVNSEASTIHTSVRNSEVSGVDLPNPIAESTPIEVVRSPIMTRATGGVRDLPNVQHTILEFRRRKRKSN